MQVPFQELIGDHFGVDVKRNGDHFGVDLGIISGLRIISGSGSFPGLYRTRAEPLATQAAKKSTTHKL